MAGITVVSSLPCSEAGLSAPGSKAELVFLSLEGGPLVSLTSAVLVAPCLEAGRLVSRAAAWLNSSYGQLLVERTEADRFVLFTPLSGESLGRGISFSSYSVCFSSSALPACDRQSPCPQQLQP